MSPEYVVLVVLLLFPRMSGGNRACIERNRDRIVSQLREAEEVHGIPPGVMAAVAFRETHLGCDRGEGGNWGAPISPARRHTAGTHLHAARALATSYRVCAEGWERALRRFHTGLCPRSRHPRANSYPDNTIRLLHRMWDYGFSRPWRE